MGSPQVILIDTHVLVWWAGGEHRRLSGPAKNALNKQRDGGQIFISSASAWEIAILVARGRIGISKDVLGWLNAIGRMDGVEFVPINNEIAVMSTQLPGEFHKDPADRYIVATSQKLTAPLVTADEKIRRYPHVQTIW
jgi:PIN domain nuclease of toxin-antitoxin system